MMNYNTNVTPTMQTTLNVSLNSQLPKQENTTTSEAPSLLKEKSETPGQTCINCNTWKTLDNFETYVRTTCSSTYVRNKCHTCRNEDSRTLRLAKKQAPPRPNAWDLCGREDKQLVEEQEHKTGKFRGWLCTKRKTGWGKMGGKGDGLEEAGQ